MRSLPNANDLSKITVNTFFHKNKLKQRKITKNKLINKFDYRRHTIKFFIFLDIINTQLNLWGLFVNYVCHPSKGKNITTT